MKYNLSAFSCIIIFFIFSLLSVGTLKAQTEVDERAVISFKKGLGFFDPDSVFGVNIRFRMQNRAAMSTESASDFSPREFEANVRRLRLRFDGFMASQDFTYYLQLSFSRGDQDWDNTGFPGIVRDAMVFYNFSPSFYMGMGQGKLPGNRQRVVSSGSLQFADRSATNAMFNIDRDFGVMAYYNNKLAGLPFNLKTAISTGEGRNINRTDDGLSYTGRLELLPFGEFLSDGDFLEGDLLHEPTPKLSMAFTSSFNHKATRMHGQRGIFMPESQDILSMFADAMAKFQGWALMLEYAHRSISDQQIYIVNNVPVYSYTGWGFNSQLSYHFFSGFEIAGRFTRLEPSDKVAHLVNPETIYTLGFNKYLPNHRNKLQLNLSYHKNTGPGYVLPGRNFWNIMFQVETGI
jgi:phosphate-selective porin OprO and OprP